MLLNEDCLNSMQEMQSESVNMIYLDPPFFTQKNHSLKDKNGYEFSFSDTWDSLDDYVLYLKNRLIEGKRVLKNDGSIFLHCDNTASHYLRILLDEIFGSSNFQSEIIWTYKRWSNSKNGLLNAHQTIFFYTKTNKFKFNKLFTEYSPTTNIDQILQDRIRNQDGKTAYKMDTNGSAIYSNEKKGVPLSDVWDIPFLNPKAKERVGYPTQKPILLLEKIIEISTNENDLILDPFCGSGTTLVAASLLKRKYIGIDINPEAIILAKHRLKNPMKTESMLIKKGKDAYSSKTDSEKQILSNFECNIVQRNKGIDAFLIKLYKGAPVAIRIQKPLESLSSAADLLYQAGLKKGCSLTVLIRTNNNIESICDGIPQNMVVLDSYQFAVNTILDKYTIDDEHSYCKSERNEKPHIAR